MLTLHACCCLGTAVAGSQRYHASSHVELLTEAQASLHASNAYERKRGFALGACVLVRSLSHSLVTRISFVTSYH